MYYHLRDTTSGSRHMAMWLTPWPIDCILNIHKYQSYTGLTLCKVKPLVTVTATQRVGAFLVYIWISFKICACQQSNILILQDFVTLERMITKCYFWSSFRFAKYSKLSGTLNLKYLEQTIFLALAGRVSIMPLPPSDYDKRCEGFSMLI